MALLSAHWAAVKGARARQYSRQNGSSPNRERGGKETAVQLKARQTELITKLHLMRARTEQNKTILGKNVH